MRDLTVFQKGPICGARMAGASVTKTAELLGFSRATIFRIMTIQEAATEVISARFPNLSSEIDVH